MLTYLLLIVLQLAIGIGFGFYLSRDQTRLSSGEIKIGAGVILLVSAIVLFRTDALSLQSALMNIMAITSMIGGIMLGELIHIRLARRVMNRVDKKAIFHSVERLSSSVRKAVSAGEEGRCARMDRQLKSTLLILGDAKKSAIDFHQEDLAKKIDQLSELCVSFAKIAERISSDDKDLKMECNVFSRKLQHLSWRTLRQFESNVKADLAYSWFTIVYAIKTVQK